MSMWDLEGPWSQPRSLGWGTGGLGEGPGRHLRRPRRCPVPARATKALSLPLLPACRKVPEFCGLHFPQKMDRGDSAIATL